LPGAVNADFAPLGGVRRLFPFKLRLKGGCVHEHGVQTHLPELRQ